MMKLFKLFLITLALSLMASAQNYSVISGSNVQYAGGAKIALGQVCFLGTDDNDQPINFQAGGGGQVLKKPVCAAVTAGVIAGGFQVANPLHTFPLGVKYRITVTAAGLEQYRCAKAAFTGGIFNFDTFQCPITTVFPVAGDVVSGNLTVNGDLTVTGTVTGAFVCATCVVTNPTVNQNIFQPVGTTFNVTGAGLIAATDSAPSIDDVGTSVTLQGGYAPTGGCGGGGPACDTIGGNVILKPGTGTLPGIIQIQGNVRPSITNAFSLGTTSLRFANGNFNALDAGGITWNDGLLHNGVKVDIINSSSTSTSKLLQLATSGVSQFSVDPTGFITGKAITPPGTPDAGYGALYFKTSAKLWCGKDDAGVEACVGSGSTTLQGKNLTSALGSTGGTLGSNLFATFASPVTKSANYAAVTGDMGTMFLVSGSSATISLPQAGTTGFESGWWCIVKSSTIGGFVKVGTTTSTIDGTAGITLLGGQQAVLISDGTNYQVIWMVGFFTNPVVGTGMSLQNADSTTAGGNGRGQLAVDLQLSRSAATQVAGGTNSFAAGRDNTTSGINSPIAIGYGNTASGATAVAMGWQNTASGTTSVAMGDQSTASNTDALALGFKCTASGSKSTCIGGDFSTASGANSFAYGGFDNKASGQYGYVSGVLGSDRALYNARIHSSGGLASQDSFPGRNQDEWHLLSKTTAGASSVRLTADEGAAGAANCVNLANLSVASFDIDFLAVKQSTGDTLLYSVTGGLITRGANAAATTLVSGGTFTAGATTTTPPTLGAAPTVTADTTNGCMNISVTPPAANAQTWYFSARVHLLFVLRS